jgi:hypothetical protein
MLPAAAGLGYRCSCGCRSLRARRESVVPVHEVAQHENRIKSRPNVVNCVCVCGNNGRNEGGGG